MYLSGGIEVKAYKSYDFIIKSNEGNTCIYAEKPSDFGVGTCLGGVNEITFDCSASLSAGASGTVISLKVGDEEIGKIGYTFIYSGSCGPLSYYPSSLTTSVGEWFRIDTLLQQYNEMKSENYDYFKVTSIVNDNTSGTTTIYLTPYHEGDEEKQTTSSDTDTGSNKPQLSAFERSLRAHEGMIKAAPSGSTVKIVGDESFNALPAGLIQEFMKKGDVDLEFSYSYKGQSYTITIPAGTKLESGIPWYGPMYLWGHFGNPAWTAR